MDDNLYTDDMVHRMLQDLIEGPEPSYQSSSSCASVGSIESGYGVNDFNSLLCSPPGLSSIRPNTLERELNEMSDDFERFKMGQLQKLRSLESRYNFKEFTCRQNDLEEIQILRARVHELKQKSPNFVSENNALKEQVSTLQAELDGQTNSNVMLQKEVEGLKMALSSERKARSRFDEEMAMENARLVAENRNLTSKMERKLKVEKLLKGEVQRLNAKMCWNNRNFKNQLRTKNDQMQSKIAENKNLEEKVSCQLKQLKDVQKKHKTTLEIQKSLESRLKNVHKMFESERENRILMSQTVAVVKETLDLKSTIIKKLDDQNEQQQEEVIKANALRELQVEQALKRERKAETQLTEIKKAYDGLRIYTDKLQKCLAEERKKNVEE